MDLLVRVQFHGCPASRISKFDSDYCARNCTLHSPMPPRVMQRQAGRYLRTAYWTDDLEADVPNKNFLRALQHVPLCDGNARLCSVFILNAAGAASTDRGSGREVSPAFRTVWKETGAYGLFLGTFAGGYCIVDEAISAIGGLQR